MPGVPSGRGCDGCRRQKKKCDQASPCSRCARLRIECVGAGVQRYKFAPLRRYDKSRSGSPAAVDAIVRAVLLQQPPPYGNSALISSFGAIVGPSTEDRYNLATGYGDYLVDVVKLLGTNRALDAAVAAVTEAHALYIRKQPITVECLQLYNTALRSLRLSLDDALIAQSDATLCAVMVLMVCQDLTGTNRDSYTKDTFTGHCEGASQLLKVRRNHWPAGVLGHKLSLSVCTAVLIESFYNPRIKFSEADLQSFSTLLQSGTGAAGIILSSICESFLHMNAWEDRHSDTSGVFALPIKVRQTCQTVAAARLELKDIITLIDTALEGHHPQRAVLVHARRQLERFDVITIGICLLNNLVACAIDLEGRDVYLSNNTSLIREVLDIAEAATIQGPFGDTQMPLTLCAAWIAATDEELRAEVEVTLRRYRESSAPSPGMDSYLARLETMAEQLFDRLGVHPADLRPLKSVAMELAHEDTLLPSSAAGQAVSLGKGIAYVKPDERSGGVTLSLRRR